MTPPIWEDPKSGVNPKQEFDDLRMQVEGGFGERVASICAAIVCVGIALGIALFAAAIILAWAFEIAAWIIRG